MEIDLSEIELFQQLTQIQVGDLWYDLHNDHACTSIRLHSGCLKLLFVDCKTQKEVTVHFSQTSIDMLLADLPSGTMILNLTIDLMYRGRALRNDQLLEYDSDGRSYVYIDFVEGIKLEFWCRSIEFLI